MVGAIRGQQEEPTSVASIRVVVAGYGPIYRAGLCSTLPTHDPSRGVAVVGATGDVDRAVSLVRLLRPAVILTDLDFAGRDALPELTEACPSARVVLLSGMGRSSEVPLVRRSGVAAHLHAPIDIDELLDALSAVAAGVSFVDPSPEPALRRAAPIGGWDALREARGLTQREYQVLQMIALGHTNTEVAEQLVISVRTVETHRSNIQRKLGVRSRAELARAAFRGLRGRAAEGMA